MSSTSLDTIPQELVEHIAFFAATKDILGPPSGIVSLLLTNRRLNSFLSFQSNPHLYAQIFESKFDITPTFRRFTRCTISARALANELQRRSLYLKLIRDREGCLVNNATDPLFSRHDEETLHEILWLCFLMTLENEGKNERQLISYAHLDEWLKLFWFDNNGASLMVPRKRDIWPQNNERSSLAMWLLWFFLKLEDYSKDEHILAQALSLAKLVALGAHQYPLSSPYWAEVLPDSRSGAGTVTHYSQRIHVTAPPIAVSAVLCYLTLVEHTWGTSLFSPRVASRPLFTRPPASTRQSLEWETVWHRCLSSSTPKPGDISPCVFDAGSLDGIWEGTFTYTEFTSYAALLSGAPPHVLLSSIVAQHRHTWKLREYHFQASDSSTEPVSPGDPLRGYLPTGVRIEENSNGIVVWEPGRPSTIQYKRVNDLKSVGDDDDDDDDDDNVSRVRDIIIIGEGHSSWGQFNLLGRVRSWDGFVSLSKEYVDGDRGTWLYRGYLVGNANGRIAGRWRDTLSPPHVPGYEGCFAMSRRR